MKIPYAVYNSFSDIAFGGNPAGIVFEDQPLNNDMRQKIARQLNHVETIFITKMHDKGLTFLYFTPHKQLPIAGHPSVAAAAYLHANQIESRDTYSVNTLAGSIHVQRFEEQFYVTQQSASVAVQDTATTNEILSVFSLHEDNLVKASPPAVVNAGLGHLIFEVQNFEVLTRMHFIPDALQVLCDRVGARECQIFTRSFDGPQHHAYTRNFCPRYGEEDPACGNGNAALGAYFNAFLPDIDSRGGFSFLQGSHIGRPSVIQVKINDDTIWIGGNAVLMQEGYVYLEK